MVGLRSRHFQAAAIGKMILMPVIGIFMILGFRRNTTLFPPDQKSEHYVWLQIFHNRPTDIFHSAFLCRLSSFRYSECSEVSRFWSVDAIVTIILTLPVLAYLLFIRSTKANSSRPKYF